MVIENQTIDFNRCPGDGLSVWWNIGQHLNYGPSVYAWSHTVVPAESMHNVST